MGAISELIRTEKDGTISFGDYTLDKKAKLDNFEHDGDFKVAGADAGTMKTNLGGKLSLSVELDVVSQVAVKVEKC